MSAPVVLIICILISCLNMMYMNIFTMGEQFTQWKDAAFNTMMSVMKTCYQFYNKLLVDYVKLSGGEDVGLVDMAAEQLRKFLSRVGGEKLANTSWIVDGVICLLDWHVMVPFLECVTTCHLS